LFLFIVNFVSGILLDTTIYLRTDISLNPPAYLAFKSFIQQTKRNRFYFVSKPKRAVLPEKTSYRSACFSYA